ncbi:MAG: hypothetical protein FJ161_04110 [Gammaproteobacteria bacterium]|nr:hypothetical protein [Gammaproteobacteria bacterium]
MLKIIHNNALCCLTGGLVSQALNANLLVYEGENEVFEHVFSKHDQFYDAETGKTTTAHRFFYLPPAGGFTSAQQAARESYLFDKQLKSVWSGICTGAGISSGLLLSGMILSPFILRRS